MGSNGENSALHLLQATLADYDFQPKAEESKQRTGAEIHSTLFNSRKYNKCTPPLLNHP